MVAEEPGAAAAPKRRAPKKRRRHGEGSIYRRGKRWTGSLDLGFETAPDGTIRRRRVTVTGATADEVARELGKLRSRADIGLMVPDGQATVASFLRSWLEAKLGSLRANTVTVYRRAIERSLIPFLGHHRLDRLSPAHVQGFITAKLAEGLSVTTVRTTTRVLIGALKMAQEWGLVTRNVASLAHLPPPRRYPARPLTADESRMFLAAIEKDELRALYWVLIGSGLRIGEALGLRWNDVDFEAGQLHIRHSLQKVRADHGPLGPDTIRLTPTAALVPPKTSTSRTSLALPHVVTAALQRHRAEQEEARQAAGSAWRDHGLVFPTPRPLALGRNLPPGSPADYRGIMARYRGLLDAAGLPQIRLHDLRHTCAVLLIEGGDGNLKQVQRQLRHSSIKTTLDVYGHVTDALQARAAADVDRLLGGAATGGEVDSPGEEEDA